MNELLFAVNATVPICLMVLIGYFAKRIGLLSQTLAGSINKLVFRLFLPAMLFLNVYKIESFADIDFTFVWYAIIATLVFFLLGLFAVLAFTKENAKRGVLLQAAFRANYAFVGISLASSLFGDKGAMMATVLSAFVIPLFNLLAIFALSFFSSEKRPSLKAFFVEMSKNPPIVSIAAGFLVLLVRALFVHFGIAFRLSDIEPIYKTLSSLSAVATPLALVALGGQFEFSAIGALKKEIIFGVCARCCVVPILSIGVAYLIGIFEGAHFATFVAAFCTPVAVSSVPMVQEMRGDVALAGQIVVWSTLCSAVTVFLASYLLKLAGIF